MARSSSFASPTATTSAPIATAPASAGTDARIPTTSPPRKRQTVAQQTVHLDPEFQTFTYGDPTPPKRSLRKLERGDYLIFYCGLQHWDEADGWRSHEAPGLYLIGYFVVEVAGIASQFDDTMLRAQFGRNFHVRYPSVFQEQRNRLVLVKGGTGSRLLTVTHRISSVSKDRSGKPLKVLSPQMQRIFGNFDGRISIQRSPPRWVRQTYVERTIDFVNRLR